MKIYLKKFRNIIVLTTFVIQFATPNMLYADLGIVSAKMNFWDTTQKGANIFNQSVSLSDIKAAKKYGIKFIRLAPDKLKSSSRDFLIGDADDYKKLDKKDLAKLKQILDMCYEEQMPVILTMLSLPGSRWKQNNQNKDDLRIWAEEKYRIQAARFWHDLAAALKDHPAIVGYNLLNEPHPERIFSVGATHLSAINQPEVQKMLHEFYETLIKSLRLSDAHVPIILDSSAYADPETFKLFKPFNDKNIIYSFHMYEPYGYTNYKTNKGRFSYPGLINGEKWDKEMLEKYLSYVTIFQSLYDIPSNRILVGEFGGHRMTLGLDKYFQDLISIFTDKDWHFAFYAFREDAWDGMDYELGDKKLPWTYWQAIDEGKQPYLDRKDSYPAFSVIKKSLQK